MSLPLHLKNSRIPKFQDMKNFTILCGLVVCLTAVSCNKTALKYDFSKADSKSEVDSLLSKIAKDHKDVTSDNAYGLNEIKVKGMHYDGVPITTALITDHYVLLTTDTTSYSAKKLLETIESKKGLTKKMDSYSKAIEFEWDTEIDNKKLVITLKNGKHLAALGDKDYGELTIRFKPVYKNALANMHKDIISYENEAKYELKIDANGCEYDVIFNDIILDESTTDYEFILNDYITHERSSMKFTVKPLSDDNGGTSKNFREYATFSATVIDESTGETIAAIHPTLLKGNGPIAFEFDFNSTLPYYPKAWTAGDDLRNDKDLKEKVIALYNRIGEAILTKDEKAIDDLFYQKNFEKQQVNYNTDFDTSVREWEKLVAIQEMSYKYTVANDFSIEFNAGGKLIYTYSKDKTDMLIFTGKAYNDKMNYFLYQPKGSNELKLIR